MPEGKPGFSEEEQRGAEADLILPFDQLEGTRDLTQLKPPRIGRDSFKIV